MYCKASYFNDMDTASDILRTQNPKHAKSLGKQVKNFKMNAWRLVCDDYMRKGLKEKFVQNKQFADFLLKTNTTTLAELIPMMTIGEWDSPLLMTISGPKNIGEGEMSWARFLKKSTSH